ncbi:unnamed protein product [Heligmosomoides polygyrus]|uniref:PHD-type domain-containing protein n=1 Tax=Heligmosomoides polygyrus TaxID=6339 RepID=A0A3P7ZYW0_HELPZ|nr:unnamed protein product [Heligmosomoides polygyrus]
MIEYEWPFKSGDKYFLQEQVGDLLDIKSFSRKFPDMSRRKVEKVERDWLCDTYNIHQTMNETQLRDLCAMRSVEIHDLMASEYPAIYQEFQKVTGERLKALMVEQAKEMEAIKNDSKKLAELREKAMKSAADFNRELQLTKKLERQHYWDVQTSIIQSATNKWRKVPAKYTKPSPYPVALIHGQFQNYYRKFTSSELRRLPFGSVLDGEHLFLAHRDPSPPPINVSDKEVQSSFITSQLPHGVITYYVTRIIATHPACLEMTDEMALHVTTYPWQCIECKRCSVCTMGDREDAMIFCDKCDRGFHTYCIGLPEAPQGVWICQQYCNPGANNAATPKKTPARKSVAAV